MSATTTAPLPVDKHGYVLAPSKLAAGMLNEIASTSRTMHAAAQDLASQGAALVATMEAGHGVWGTVTGTNLVQFNEAATKRQTLIELLGKVLTAESGDTPAKHKEYFTAAVARAADVSDRRTWFVVGVDYGRLS